MVRRIGALLLVPLISSIVGRIMWLNSPTSPTTVVQQLTTAYLKTIHSNLLSVLYLRVKVGIAT